MKFCNELDCPLHPDYKEPQIENQIQFVKNDWRPTIRMASSINFSYSIGRNKHSIPIECLFCKYRIEQDMKKLIIVEKAKSLLKGET